jgi:hypothetical protein
LEGIDADTGCFGIRVSFDIAFRGDGKSYAVDVKRVSDEQGKR